MKTIKDLKKKIIEEIKEYYNPKKHQTNIVRQDYKRGHLCGFDDFEASLKQSAIEDCKIRLSKIKNQIVMEASFL